MSEPYPIKAIKASKSVGAIVEEELMPEPVTLVSAAQDLVRLGQAAAYGTISQATLDRVKRKICSRSASIPSLAPSIPPITGASSLVRGMTHASEEAARLGAEERQFMMKEVSPSEGRRHLKWGHLRKLDAQAQEIVRLKAEVEKQQKMINFYSYVTTTCFRCNHIILTSATRGLPPPLPGLTLPHLSHPSTSQALPQETPLTGPPNP
jgi:hypothetical protein